jgi:hypothetical protein
LRRAGFVFALALIGLAIAPPGGAQAIVSHSADGPARLDGPWLLYEGDPPGGPSASTDPRLGQIYWLGNAPSPAQGRNIIWLRATVTPDEPLSRPALLLNPSAADC